MNLIQEIKRRIELKRQLIKLAKEEIKSLEKDLDRIIEGGKDLE